MWGKIKKFYSPWIDVCSFLILIMTVFYSVYYYAQLPDEIPTHFNFAGEPDTWSGKGTIIGFLILYVFLLLQCFGLNYFLFINQKDPKESLHFINLPFVKKESLTETQLNGMVKYTTRMLAVMNLCISILFVFILIGMVQTALGNQNGLGTGIVIMTVLLVVVSIYYIWKMYQEVK
ncbi:DUF1648 domain-containing protein [Oceanobacillus sp. Castelsardo]|uniref:DUF1648 domain-containing protein n=1 Tax=Oceanobacillus sp. Castelsardo TaxID=1851204 RepID=UPI000837FA30|nr:DUF1648 domain-containing protein [Oceanobacillus sp. Castelsardo]